MRAIQDIPFIATELYRSVVRVDDIKLLVVFDHEPADVCGSGAPISERFHIEEVYLDTERTQDLRDALCEKFVEKIINEIIKQAEEY